MIFSADDAHEIIIVFIALGLAADGENYLFETLVITVKVPCCSGLDEHIGGCLKFKIIPCILEISRSLQSCEIAALTVKIVKGA